MAKRKLPPNWQTRIEFVVEEETDNQLEIHCQFIKGKTPKGFMRKIGEVIVEDGWLEHIEIEQHFKRRGLGTKLLRLALERAGTITVSWRGATFEGNPFYEWFAKNVANRYTTDFFKERLVLES